jgi:hypothetical protein
VTMVEPELTAGTGGVEIPDRAPLETTEQPLHVRLRFGSELHGKMLARLAAWIEAGSQHVQQRWDDWTRVDEALRLYVDLRREARRGDRSDRPYSAEIPFERAIVMPVTYWSLLTRQAQKWSVLTSRDPLIHLEGRGGEDQRRARLMEARLRWDLEQTNAHLKLWQLSWDDERYGICCLHDSWEEETEDYVSSLVPNVPPEIARVLGVKNGRRVAKQWNEWDIIDPYQLVLDPDCPAAMPQRARYIGHLVNGKSWLDLKEAELDPDTGTGLYFNLSAARKSSRSSRQGYSGREYTASFSEDEPEGLFPSVELASIQARIIPQEWGLSPSTRAEVWRFAIVNRQVIVRAHPAINRHRQYSYSIGEGELDMHAPFAPGPGEQLDGIQRVGTWLVSSHLENVRRILNDALLLDPSLVDEGDLLNPGPARHVRLTKLGQELLQRGILPIGNMVQQLPMTDVTGQHLATLQHFLNWGQRIVAASDVQQGMPLPDRRTLGEVQQVQASGSQRIGVSAQLLDRQVMATAAARAVSNIGQFATIEQWVRITGDLVEQLGGQNMLIKPSDLAGGSYDYVPHTATSAPDPARSAAVWGGLMQMLAQAAQVLLAPDPATGRRINPHAVFNEMLRSQGVRYFDQFYMAPPPPQQAPPGMGPGGPAGPGGPGRPPVRVLPDDQVEELARQGNLAPTGLGRR